MEKTLEVHLKELREEIVKQILDMCDASCGTPLNVEIHNEHMKCARIARGEKNG